jgi:hypothetical protein
MLHYQLPTGEAKKLSKRESRAVPSPFSLTGSGSMRAISTAPAIVEKISLTVINDRLQ